MQSNMDSPSTAERLPSDVLGQVFHHYLDEETMYYPMETMLLVCKAWSDAVLGHQLLWARLKIYLGEGPSLKIWSARLPRRLERAGDTTPLEIDLRNIFRSKEFEDSDLEYCPHLYDRTSPCNCSDIANEVVERLLEILTGADGSLCKRWKSLRLCIYSSIQAYNYLNYSAPNLTSLCFEGLSGLRTTRLLPSLPALQSLHVLDCRFLTLPEVDSLQELLIDLGPRPVYSFTELSKVQTAAQLESLTLNINSRSRSIPGQYHLPDIMPRLSSLSLTGNQYPVNVATFQASNLRSLSISIHIYGFSEHRIHENPSLPFSQLLELKLACPEYFSDDCDRMAEATANLLSMCTGIARIEGNDRSLVVALRLYYQRKGRMWDCVERMAGRSVTFRSSDTQKEMKIDTLDDMLILEKLARELGLVAPHVGREDILESWAWPLD